MHLGGDTEVSTSSLYDALEDLNQAFAAQGEEYEGYYALDSKIRFCLAQVDPDNNPTTGVTYHDMSAYPEYVEDGIYTASGGAQTGMPDAEVKALAAWDHSEYFNIYVVTEINGNDAGWGIQGYSYIGYTNDYKDGPVVLYNVLGTENVKPSAPDSKVLIHEVGHAMNLFHTFTGSQECNDSETNCETQGDRVCDTPPNPQGGGCSNTECGVSVSNYMDYIPNSCRRDFTEGQILRMHEELISERDDLWTGFTSPCDAPVDFDALVSSVDYQQATCTPSQDISVEVVSVGNQIPGMVTVTLSQASPAYSESVDVYLSSAAVVTFNGFPTNGGTYYATVEFDGDEDPSNNTYQFYTYSSTVVEHVVLEIEHNFWANDNSWQLVNEQGDVVIEGGGYMPSAPDEVHDLCLAPGCYDLTIWDTHGDGFMSIVLGPDTIWNGQFLFTLGDEVLLNVEEEAFSELNAQFCIEEPYFCLGDFNEDGWVGSADMLYFLTQLGSNNSPADITGDGIVDISDFNRFLGLWNGPCGSELDLTLVEEVREQLMSMAGKVFDLSGREVKSPRTSGIYIIFDDAGRAEKRYIPCD